MAEFIHKGNKAQTSGELPKVGSVAPAFTLTGLDLKDVSLGDLTGKRIVLNIFPSIDTSTCAMSVRRFNQLASGLTNTLVVNVSKDLPYAQRRFCAAEGITNVISLSEYKNNHFSSTYHVDIVSGSILIGLMARAVIVLDENTKVIHVELVYDLSHEPDYNAVMHALIEEKN